MDKIKIDDTTYIMERNFKKEQAKRDQEEIESIFEMLCNSFDHTYDEEFEQMRLDSKW